MLEIIKKHPVAVIAALALHILLALLFVVGFNWSEKPVVGETAVAVKVLKPSVVPASEERPGVNTSDLSQALERHKQALEEIRQQREGLDRLQDSHFNVPAPSENSKIAPHSDIPGHEKTDMVDALASTKARVREQQQRRLELEQQAREEAEEKARREVEKQAKLAAMAKARAEAKKQAEQRAREEAKRKASEKAKQEAKEKAREEVKANAKREAEKQARLEAEAKAKREALEKAAWEKAKREAQSKAEAEEKVKRLAEQKAREAAEAKRLAEQKVREEVEAKAREQAETERRRQEAEQGMAQLAAVAKARREAERKSQAEAEAKRRAEAAAAAQAKAAAARAEAGQQAQVREEALGNWGNKIVRHVRPRWQAPPGSGGMSAKVRVQISRSGYLKTLRVLSCNGSVSFCQSIEAAFKRAEPLPSPTRNDLFDENLNLTFRR